MNFFIKITYSVPISAYATLDSPYISSPAPTLVILYYFLFFFLLCCVFPVRIRHDKIGDVAPKLLRLVLCSGGRRHYYFFLFSFFFFFSTRSYFFFYFFKIPIFFRFHSFRDKKFFYAIALAIPDFEQ